MIPTILVHLKELPLTINGKLDRRALPNPSLGSDVASFVAPCNGLEEKLCQIFAMVLNVDESKISIKDNFFKLGGNSILVVKLTNKINEYYKINLRIVDIFTLKTLNF